MSNPTPWLIQVQPVRQPSPHKLEEVPLPAPKKIVTLRKDEAKKKEESK